MSEDSIWKVCESQPWGCTDSEVFLMKYRDEMFGTVGRCMFTIFRCFVSDGCVAISGAPIMPLLWDHFGWLIVIFYVIVFVLLTFGLFNLIMATIVENTMQA